MIFMQKFGIKCKKMCNSFRNFPWGLVVQEKHFGWFCMQENLKTETVTYAVEVQ